MKEQATFAGRERDSLLDEIRRLVREGEGLRRTHADGALLVPVAAELSRLQEQLAQAVKRDPLG